MVYQSSTLDRPRDVLAFVHQNIFPKGFLRLCCAQDLEVLLNWKFVDFALWRVRTRHERAC